MHGLRRERVDQNDLRIVNSVFKLAIFLLVMSFMYKRCIMYVDIEKEHRIVFIPDF